MLLRYTIWLTISIVKTKATSEATEVFSWDSFNFLWSSETHREDSLQTGIYELEYAVPLSFDLWKDKIFFAVPRSYAPWKTGGAATLCYVSLKKSSSKNPRLIPYPDWESNVLPGTPGPIRKYDDVMGKPLENDLNATSCEENDEDIFKLNNLTLYNVFRVRVDECDRLWIIDTGLTHVLGKTVRHSNPALLIFDLLTNKLIQRHEFDDVDLKNDSIFIDLVVDSSKNCCDKSYAYISTLFETDLLVYSLELDLSWRSRGNFFDSSNDTMLEVENKNITSLGIFGMAFSKQLENGFRTLFYNGFPGSEEFSVSTKFLQLEESEEKEDFELLGIRESGSKVTSSVMDPKSGVLFFTQAHRHGIGCWNSSKSYDINNLGIVIKDDLRLKVPIDIRIGRDDFLWILSQQRKERRKYFELPDVNYRVLKMNISDAIAGTPCDYTAD